MLPANDIVQARLDFVGRIPKFDAYSDAWIYQNSFESFESAAYSCVSNFFLPDVFGDAEMPVTSVIIEMVNNTTTPREEMIVGAFNPDDYVVRTRSMQIRLVHKWNDPQLYNEVYTNSAQGTEWSPVPFTTNFNSGSGKYAFEAYVRSTKDFVGTTPFSLEIRAGTVFWQPTGPVRLQGGGIIMQEYIGTVLDPDPSLGVNYADFILINDRSSAYTVPAQP
jgi:hypothetical protein